MNKDYSERQKQLAKDLMEAYPELKEWKDKIEDQVFCSIVSKLIAERLDK